MRFSIFLLLALVVAACDSGEGESIYDPDAPIGATPVIASVSPTGVVLAGVDEIVIRGENFSATPSQNQVFFADGAGAGAPGTVVAASPTELRVKVPNLPNTALQLRVSVQGARNQSNAVALPLVSAVLPFGDLDAGSKEDPRAITSRADGTLFVTLYRDGVSQGIRQLSAEGVGAPFSPETSLWTGLAPTADGALIGVRQDRGVYRLPEGTSRSTYAATASGNTLRAIAGAPDGSYWVAGSTPTPANANLYRIASDRTITAFPFQAPVQALAVANGALYVATATVASSIIVESKVWRFPFDASGAIGSGDVLYDVTAGRGAGIGASSLAVAPDGTVYVGTNAPDPVVQIASDGTASVLYPGVLPSPISGLAWAPGSKLYAIQGRTAAEVETGGVSDLFIIETRRQGPF